jgi:hypothetical protein
MSGALPFTDADFPGYAEAVAREHLVRSAACLGLNEKICGLEVKPLMAYHVRWLVLNHSPFLLKVSAEVLAEKPDILGDVMKFLWVVSPMFEPGVKCQVASGTWWVSSVKWRLRRWLRLENARDKFNRIFAPILKQRIDTVCREILEYVDEAYLDAGEPGRGDKNYYEFEVSIADELHEHYGYRVDFWREVRVPKWKFWLGPVRDLNPVHVPLKLVFQFRKCRDQKRGRTVSNSSERFISAGLEAMNARSRRVREYEADLGKQPAPVMNGGRGGYWDYEGGAAAPPYHEN